MTKYQIAKLVQWGGTVRSRKRMQKVVYLLQFAGCPFDADFELHLHGPYSQDVAGLTDQMTAQGLLKETTASTPSGEQYNYELTELADTSLRDLESHPGGYPPAGEIAPFEGLATRLLDMDPGMLELASTIAFFRRQGKPWSEALERTCRFKNLSENSSSLQQALELARSVLPQGELAQGRSRSQL
jgi:hypothetical protein